MRSIVLRLGALGLLLAFNALTPQAGILALASCLAHVPGPATADDDPRVASGTGSGEAPARS